MVLVLMRTFLIAAALLVALPTAALAEPPPPGPSGEPPSVPPPTRLVCTLKGTPKADVIRDRPQQDVICAGRGKDRIFAGDGDVVFAGRGDDRIFARNTKIHSHNLIDCGKGRKDRIRADRHDFAIGCEIGARRVKAPPFEVGDPDDLPPGARP
jgi:hypothetical protein